MEVLNDRHEIYKIFTSSCTKCKNGFNSETFTCAAFADSIPDEILEGINMHSTPLKDHGNDIVFTSNLINS